MSRSYKWRAILTVTGILAFGAALVGLASGSLLGAVIEFICSAAFFGLRELA